MSNVDGSVRIDAKLNADSFKKGIVHIRDSLSNLGKVSSASMDKPSSALATLTGKAKATETEITNLTAKMAAIKAQPITNATIENLKSSIKATETAIQAVEGEITKLQN